MAMQFTGTGGDWEPSVKYLILLVIAEIFVFGLMRALTNSGG